MLPEATIRELRDLRAMAKAVVEIVDRLTEVKEKPDKKIDADFERCRISRMKTRLKKAVL